jgi:hypothetical protein
MRQPRRGLAAVQSHTRIPLIASEAIEHDHSTFNHQHAVYHSRILSSGPCSAAGCSNDLSLLELSPTPHAAPACRTSISRIGLKGCAPCHRKQGGNLGSLLPHPLRRYACAPRGVLHQLSPKPLAGCPLWPIPRLFPLSDKGSEIRRRSCTLIHVTTLPERLHSRPLWKLLHGLAWQHGRHQSGSLAASPGA